MIIDNLLNPEWIMVECQKPILDMVVCQYKFDIPVKENTLSYTAHEYCSHKWILLGRKSFTYLQLIDNKKNPCHMREQCQDLNLQGNTK